MCIRDRLGTGFTVDWLCVIVIVVTTLWSGIEYFVKNSKVLDTKS